MAAGFSHGQKSRYQRRDSNLRLVMRTKEKEQNTVQTEGAPDPVVGLIVMVMADDHDSGPIQLTPR